MKVGLVSVFFNPCRFSRNVENALRYLDTIGHEVLVVELVFDDRQPEIPGSHVIRADSYESMMWQKERLINVAERLLPDDVDAVATIDMDILFCNPNWLEEAERLLRHFPAIQLFSGCHRTDRLGNTEPLRAAYSSQSGLFKTGGVSPGFAWAYRREVFPVFDSHIVGGGDAVMASALSGWFMHPSIRQMSLSWRRSTLDQLPRFFEITKGRMACVPGTVIHLWHGDRDNRNYESRYQILNDADFDPLRDIAHDGGAWRFISDKPEMRHRIRCYFEGRREDG